MNNISPTYIKDLVNINKSGGKIRHVSRRFVNPATGVFISFIFITFISLFYSILSACYYIVVHFSCIFMF